jgi:hypothetical protein
MTPEEFAAAMKQAEPDAEIELRVCVMVRVGDMDVSWMCDLADLPRQLPAVVPYVKAALARGRKRRA